MLDEERRSENPKIDSEHVFLPLVHIEGQATDTPVEQGFTLSGTRKTFPDVNTHYAAQLEVRESEPGKSTKHISRSNASGRFAYMDMPWDVSK